LIFGLHCDICCLAYVFDGLKFYGMLGVGYLEGVMYKYEELMNTCNAYFDSSFAPKSRSLLMIAPLYSLHQLYLLHLLLHPPAPPAPLAPQYFDFA
jgi:hypothetical protein